MSEVFKPLRIGKKAPKERCSNCRYLGKYLSMEHFGACRKRSPQITKKPNDIMAEWPLVMGEQWCGDYEKGKKWDEEFEELNPKFPTEKRVSELLDDFNKSL